VRADPDTFDPTCYESKSRHALEEVRVLVVPAHLDASAGNVSEFGGRVVDVVINPNVVEAKPFGVTREVDD
jgi:hypothetical protein